MIHDNHLAFMAEMFGSSAIDSDDYDRLRAAGKIRDEHVMPEDAALAAHAIGAIVGHDKAFGLDEARALLSDPDEFWQHLRDDPHVITEAEREAIAVTRDRIGQYIRGLSNELDVAVGHILSNVDNASRRARLVRGPQFVLDRQAVMARVVAQVKDAVADLRRDWLRVAHTEIHNAAEEAKAVVFADREPGRDPMVFKRPRQDACVFCRLLYLKPDGVTPRVFKLSTMLANGTNVGRRAGKPTRSGKSRTEWKAVLGAVHPFCQCELHRLPYGMGFDTRGQLVYVGAKKSAEVEDLDKPAANHVCEEE